ncbi:phomacin cluster regulator phmR [Parastagonospora nodorum]|nr:phomacin cluster regulator phmR [Parastagonospora nodorum]KAH4213083.1 phomacin cluster regulator phmR [Parastagonospora nodorum]KAH5381292.1 phomacin cluster regulator phmR [Parastagonospora nodorum]KAH5575440.1 phomacin cluster regulator phmR [Parastagonospora nodorum]KAH5610335.1 phomacin cluster regulator phmR [Parastagonospora nodorum]
MEGQAQPYPFAAVQRGTEVAPQAPFNFSRRYACDRCRGHKLRCIRDQMTVDSPCQRCRKAREKCTIGSSTRPVPARLNRSSQGHKLPGATSSASLTTAAPALSMPPQQALAWATSLGDTEQGDALHLSSVPWLDMFDSAMLDSACDSNHELDFADRSSGSGSGSGSRGAADDHDGPGDGRVHTITPTSQGTTAVANPFLPGHEFDFSPRFDMPGEQCNSDFEKDCAGAPVHAHLPADERSHVASVEFMHHPVAPIHPPTMASSHRTHSTASNDSSKDSTAGVRDACIQELNELSSTLTKDLHTVVDCKLASSFLFTRSNKGPDEYLFKTLDGSSSQESAIGRMLQGSEKFLDIMKRFNEPAPSTPPFVGLSLRVDAHDFGLLAEAVDGSKNSSEATQLDRRWRILHSYLERRNESPNPLSFGSWLGDNLTYGLARKPDMTAKAAVLLCYTNLLWIYETVFFVICHTLECSPSLAPAIKLPQTVPGLEINGFVLQNHPSLQIKILTQVSSYMLDSVEKALQNMLSDSTFQALLETVLQQEGLQYSPGEETGMISVRCLIDKVNKMLD